MYDAQRETSARLCARVRACACVRQAVPETLKNMLLVMGTSGVFGDARVDAQCGGGGLVALTRARVEAMCPQLSASADLVDVWRQGEAADANAKAEDAQGAVEAAAKGSSVVEEERVEAAADGEATAGEATASQGEAEAEDLR
eukprot:6207391-Pleurochrysis_carterae.AAC.4